jgi:hypothetical protein
MFIDKNLHEKLVLIEMIIVVNLHYQDSKKMN